MGKKERIIVVRTNVVVDENLVADCLKVTGLKTRRALIDHALRELLRHGRQKQVIELKGTVAGGAKYGFAIIEEKATRKQRLVKIGDILLGVEVLRIKRNAIDLLVNNREQTLKIVEMKEGTILSPSPAVKPGVAPGTMVLSRSEVDEGLQDMGSLLRQALVRPYFTAGVPDGFLISNIRAGSLYKKMGMMDGDIIQEVNHKKIQTADDVMGLLSTIKSSPGLSMTVKRKGNLETLNFQFQ